MGYLVIIIIAAIIYYYLKSGKNAPSKKEPQISVKIITKEGDNFRKRIEVGNIIASNDSGWILNPKSSFPLTIYGIDKNGAEKLKAYLDDEVRWERKFDEIVALIAQYNVTCKEIDSYVNEYRPQYLNKLEEYKAASKEWATSSEKDKNDLLAEFRERALSSIKIKPSDADVNILFNGAPKDVTVDDRLIARFNGDSSLYQFYLSRLGMNGYVAKASADDYYRKQYEALSEKGLALRGQAIETSKILDMLRMKDINEILSDVIDKPFTRKTKAVEFAISLHDINDRLSKVIAFRELFQLIAPENIDVEEIQKASRYAFETGRVLRDTYVNAARMSEEIQESRDMGFDYWVVNAEDCCPYCKAMDQKRYKNEPSKCPPYHVGCNCFIEGGFNS